MFSIVNHTYVIGWIKLVVVFLFPRCEMINLIKYTRRESYGNFPTLSVVIWFSTGTLGILATLVYVFTMRVVI